MSDYRTGLIDRKWEGPFPAILTALTNTSGVWRYSWTQQALDTTDEYEDALSPRSGDATNSWAREINNRQVAINTIVMMRFRGMADAGGGPTFEFSAPDDSVTVSTTNTNYTNTTITYTNTVSNYVTNSTVNYNASTVVFNTNTVVNVINTATYNFQAGSVLIFGGPSISYTANTTYTLSASMVVSYTGGAKITYETPVEICGYLFYCYQTETAWAANQDDWTGPSFAGAEAVVYRIGGTAARNLTGMVAEADGQVICLLNVEAYNITLKHDDSGSAAANRFYLPGNLDVILPVGAAAVCWYDPVDTRWAVLAHSGTSSATIGGAGTANYFAIWDSNTTLNTSALALSANTHVSEGRSFRIEADGATPRWLAVYSANSAALHVIAYDAEADITLATQGGEDTGVSPGFGQLTLQMGGIDTELILISNAMQQTKYSTYDGSTGTYYRGATGAIGPGAMAAGGIVYNTGTGSMGTVTSITPGRGITTSANPLVTTGTISLKFSGYHAMGVD